MTENFLLVMILLMRTSLAAILIAAGAAKLADTHSFATTLLGLGVPARQRLLVQRLALFVPLLEGGVGIATVSGLWPTLINGIVLILMGSFSLVVLVAVRRKRAVACRCFGALSESQFSPKGLARSSFLVVVAAVVFWSGRVFPIQFETSPAAAVLLVSGFLLFAVAAAHAAKTIAILKERSA
jgi:uncharacterized membrane protein YphA (DoxX/SURF4 family)